jgi:hypothetical protein
MTQESQISGPRYLKIRVPAMAAAGTDNEIAADAAQLSGKITGVLWTPDAAVVANGTNYSVLSVRNRTTGAGTALPASRSYIATNSVAFVSEAMTLSTTASDLLFAIGDVLTVQMLHTASGVLIPAGLVRIAYQLQ